MDDFEYPGIRVVLEATLDKMRQIIKIDISTDDVITPEAIEYDYKLIFEDRRITILTYNLETVLSEKVQTILIWQRCGVGLGKRIIMWVIWIGKL